MGKLKKKNESTTETDDSSGATSSEDSTSSSDGHVLKKHKNKQKKKSSTKISKKKKKETTTDSSSSEDDSSSDSSASASPVKKSGRERKSRSKKKKKEPSSTEDSSDSEDEKVKRRKEVVPKKKLKVLHSKRVKDSTDFPVTKTREISPDKATSSKITPSVDKPKRASRSPSVQVRVQVEVSRPTEKRSTEWKPKKIAESPKRLAERNQPRYDHSRPSPYLDRGNERHRRTNLSPDGREYNKRGRTPPRSPVRRLTVEKRSRESRRSRSNPRETSQRRSTKRSPRRTASRNDDSVARKDRFPERRNRDDRERTKIASASPIRDRENGRQKRSVEPEKARRSSRSPSATKKQASATKEVQRSVSPSPSDRKKRSAEPEKARRSPRSPSATKKQASATKEVQRIVSPYPSDRKKRSVEPEEARRSSRSPSATKKPSSAVKEVQLSVSPPHKSSDRAGSVKTEVESEPKDTEERVSNRPRSQSPKRREKSPWRDPSRRNGDRRQRLDDRSSRPEGTSRDRIRGDASSRPEGTSRDRTQGDASSRPRGTSRDRAHGDRSSRPGAESRDRGHRDESSRPRDGSRDRSRRKRSREEAEREAVQVKQEPESPKRTKWESDGEEQDFGGKEIKSEKKGEVKEKEKANFGLSGKLAEETNTYKGVVIKYSEPPEARIPKRRWRFYVFKDNESMPTLFIHKQSAFLIGRDRKIADFPVDHPSISKQHAALQYRLVPYQKPDGKTGRAVRPYIIDLESANGTFVNNKQIEPKRYVELKEKDVVKFGFSSREYVLLHDESKDEALDDDVTED